MCYLYARVRCGRVLVTLRASRAIYRPLMRQSARSVVVPRSALVISRPELGRRGAKEG